MYLYTAEKIQIQYSSMRYADLPIKYAKVKPIAKERDKYGRTIYAVGAVETEEIGLIEYGYLGKEAVPVAEIPDRAKPLPVDSFFKFMPGTDWEFFD